MLLLIQSTPTLLLEATKVRRNFFDFQSNNDGNGHSHNYVGQRQCGVFKPTKVISASYGQAEHDLPINYSKRQCNEFMKLALQGHSILVASGDYGVGSFQGDGTVNNGGTGCLGPQGKIFNPQYPSNCPYITSVGGTMLYANQTVYDGESVMHVDLGGTARNFSSSGGFSNYYPQPSWQKAAVSRYLTEYNPPYASYSEFEVNINTTTGIYNRIGRGYPDVSANGANFRAYTDGNDYHYYGSSLASPLFASVLVLVRSVPSSYVFCILTYDRSTSNAMQLERDQSVSFHLFSTLTLGY